MYTFYAISGAEKPAALSQAFKEKRIMGRLVWDQKEFNLSIPISTGGIVCWVAACGEGMFRPVRLNPPAVVEAGKFLAVNIQAKKAIL